MLCLYTALLLCFRLYAFFMLRKLILLKLVIAYFAIILTSSAVNFYGF